MSRWVLACLFVPALHAQELNWEGVLQQGLDAVDGELSEHGYVLDRDVFAQLPDYADLVRFWSSIQASLQEGGIEDLAWLKPELAATLEFLENQPAAASYVPWLRQQLDYFEVAEESVQAVPEAPRRPPDTTPARPRPMTIAPRPPPAQPEPASVKKQVSRRAREADTWKRKVASRPKPARADELVPRLKRIFREEGVPEELVWLAEVESTLDPGARSPVGAAGLFQFMPPTAQRFGLRTRLPDERLHPDKSARAAARYLTFLHRRFEAWPLALAAYNAGEGRVGRVLARSAVRTFDAIADDLPPETQMYVPKIAAILDLREGVSLADLPPPRS